MVRFDPLQKWAPRCRNAAIGGYETPSCCAALASRKSLYSKSTDLPRWYIAASIYRIYAFCSAVKLLYLSGYLRSLWPVSMHG
jgi:hypothetical protein